jgi:hypothetical protein
MTKKGHMPGPWYQDGKFIRNLPECDYVCEINFPHCDPEVQANARLIAAAPDMLEALRALAELPVGAELLIDDDTKDTVLYKNGGKGISARDVLNARAAIAKATSA